MYYYKKLLYNDMAETNLKKSFWTTLKAQNVQNNVGGKNRNIFEFNKIVQSDSGTWTPDLRKY